MRARLTIATMPGKVSWRDAERRMGRVSRKQVERLIDVSLAKGEDLRRLL